ncbi:hypothetical protein ACSBPH_04825 [Microbacterium sp. F51-2R]|jgi:hypothetical protein|uniref:hypothetical protein n=1 Tax=Microbacterium sp. F51-2R TaxID=3445777 RepID=UPI003F9F4E66
MQDPMGEELRALRERAYGPDADIEDDPAALERLLELEASVASPSGKAATTGNSPSAPVNAERAAETSRIASRVPVDPLRPSTAAEAGESRTVGAGGDASPVSEGGDTGQVSEGTDAAAIAAESVPPPSPPSRRRRTLVVRAATLGLALLLGAALAYGVMQLRPGSVATLAAAPDADWPDFLGDRQDGSTVFEDFFGLTVAIVPQPWGREDDVPCLFVLHSAGGAAITTVGCGAGGFAPTAALAVTATLPDTLTAEYPVGTALQFVLDDDRVVVYADRG